MDSANRLTSVGGMAVTTDANGNLLADNTGKSDQWDARGRLTQVSQNGTVLASYTYATNNTRSSMTENGVTTSFTLDGTMCVNEAVGSSNTPTVFGPTGPISRGTQWFTPDGSGSIAAVTDNTGLQVAQNCYGLFGQVATTNPNSGDPLQYLGGMADQAAGGDYLGSGYYEPSIGMSIGAGGGGNLGLFAGVAAGAAGAAAGLSTPGGSALSQFGRGGAHVRQCELSGNRSHGSGRNRPFRRLARRSAAGGSPRRPRAPRPA